MDPFLKSVVAGLARHGLTAAAGALVTAGALDPSQTESFVTIGLGVVVWGVGAAWSYYQKVRTVG